ncbi:MAG TPA: sodium:calcium symporter [Opitutae bacterium]|nr:sodium:calcium symporter [Opitutae bacterium]
MSQPKEAWGSKLGVIMAVAGSAVGLGNFLRFPGLVADKETGGGAFLIAYFISLLVVGLPICWAEWTLGRFGGSQGFNSSPGIFHSILRKPWGKYVGLLGFIVPVGVYFYYVVIESWCLGYAWHSFSGNLDLKGAPAFGDFFSTFTGQSEDGAVFSFGSAFWFFAVVFILNFIIIYRGLSKGIEFICNWGMPLLIVIALVLLVRVMTLGTPDPSKPDLSIWNGLGYMWNPTDIAKGLSNPEVWLKAASQIFFTLSVGFGVIITYASYLKPKDDVALSGLTATAANEFCEVALGGLITVPAAFAFLGASAVAGGTFALGFNVLPQVFAGMPGGHIFGGLFFTLLFIAAITSSLSMLQPGIAFLEEGLGLDRRRSVALLGLITAAGCLLVVWFSRDLKALSTVDFWIGDIGIFLQGTLLIYVFNLGFGTERGWQHLHHGADIQVPGIFRHVLRWVSPIFLTVIFSMFVLRNVAGWNLSFTDAAFMPTDQILDLVGSEAHPANRVARLTALFLFVFAAFSCLLIHLAGRRWSRQSR